MTDKANSPVFSSTNSSKGGATDLEPFRQYIFADDLDDRARLAIQHSGMKPEIVKHMTQALDEYGLAAHFAATTEAAGRAGASVKPARVLDYGCGEGLFLHDFAELLESRGLISGVELNGIDKNGVAIITAEDYAQVSTPPRPYLNFYVHDGEQPLEACRLLLRDGYPYGPASFDFIYATMVMEHLPEARHHVEELYRALTPGGVIYFYGCDLARTQAEFAHFHPTLRFFGEAVTKMIMSVNPGVNVAVAQAEWLNELGAEMVQATPVITVVGGDSEYGRWLLKDTVMIARGAGRILVQKGVITQARFEEMMANLYRELTAERQGQGWFIATMARKPLTKA